MSESKPKTAVDAARAVSQALKKNLEDIKANVKYTPQEAVLKVRGELRKHIIEMGNYLAELQKKEGNLSKAEVLSKPPVSQAQRRAMGAAASGHSNLGIPKNVGKEFIDKDPGGKLPEKSKTKKAEGSFSMSDSNSEGSASVSVSDDGKARVRVDTKKGEQSAEVSHVESSQPESSADKHKPTADEKKKKVAAFVPGPGKMVKDEAKAFVPGPGKMVKAVHGMEGDPMTSPLAKKGRTVFDILGKANVAPAVSGRAPAPNMIVKAGGMAKATADELEERSSMVGGTVLPSDKDQKRADAEKTGSGGKTVKGPSMKGKGEKVGEGATWKATKKTEVPSLEDPNKKDDASGGTVKPDTNVKKVEVPAVQDPQKKDDGSGGIVKAAKGVKKTEVPALDDPNKKDDASGGTVKPDTNVKKGETFPAAKRSMSGDINKEKVVKTANPGFASSEESSSPSSSSESTKKSLSNMSSPSLAAGEKSKENMSKTSVMSMAQKPPFKPSFKGHSAALGVGSKTSPKGVTTTTSFDPMSQTVSRKKTMDAPPGMMSPGYTQGQNQKMPPRQQSTKMPFGKAELEKDIKCMDEHFAKSKKGNKK